MTSYQICVHIDKILRFSRHECHECVFKAILIESNICAPVFLNLLNSLRKGDKMLANTRILSLFPTSLNTFNNT